MKCYQNETTRDIIYNKINKYIRKNSDTTIISWNDNKDTKFKDVKKLVETLNI